MRSAKPAPAPFGGPAHRLLLVGVALLLAGCGERGCGAVIARYHESSAATLQQQTKTHQLRASKRRTSSRPPKAAPPVAPPYDKLHPDIRARLSQVPLPPDGRFLVTFVDTVLPAVHTLGLSKQDLLDALMVRRTPLYAALSTDLDTTYQALPLEQFWLIHALLVRVPYALVDSLSRRQDVIRIEPEFAGPPPQPPPAMYGLCGSESKDMTWAREHLGSDAYLEAGYGDGSIALLDTGVESDHPLIRDSGRIRVLFDCSSSECVRVETQDDLWASGHGTASAAILTGESSGDDWSMHAGMTRVVLHSYNVYGYNDTGGVEVSLPAAVRAFESVLVGEAKVCIAEIAATRDGPGSLAESVFAIYNEQVAVVAANGNLIPANGSPADASCALGVGAYCAETDEFVTSYIKGETADGRWKPDLTGPTAVFTAELGSDDGVGSYDGTSGATPFVVGALELLRDRLAHGATGVEPGHVYATLLAAADQSAASAEEGAGRVRLPTDGVLTWGRFDLAAGEEWNLPVEVWTDAAASIEVVLWWPRKGTVSIGYPESSDGSDLDLYLYDASMNPVAKSVTVTEVVEHVSAGIPAGSRGQWWTAQVYGYDVASGSKQAGYWAVWLRER